MRTKLKEVNVMRRRNIRALALSAVLLVFAPAALAGETLTLPGCVAQALSNHPSLTAAEGTVRTTDTIRYARNLHIAYYDDYVSVRIRDPWDTLRQRQHYVLVDRDKPLPARLPAELIANGALARFFSTETVTFDPASRRLVARPK